MSGDGGLRAASARPTRPRLLSQFLLGSSLGTLAPSRSAGLGSPADPSAESTGLHVMLVPGTPGSGWSQPSSAS